MGKADIKTIVIMGLAVAVGMVVFIPGISWLRARIGV